MTHTIELDGVRKTYGNTTALSDISVELEPGRVHAILGPNGAGKTTLFRILLGLTEADAGTVSLPDATVGYGFQEPRLYPGLTVEENLDLFAELTGAPSSWVATLVEQCGLARVSHRLASELSSGFAKRLDLALAFVDRPSLVILDEPFADVDAGNRSQLRTFLAEYATDERIIVVSTHRIDWLESLLDTITVIADGEVRTHEEVSSVNATDLTLGETYRMQVDNARERR